MVLGVSLRERVIGRVMNEGRQAIPTIAGQMRVSQASIYRWLDLFAETGSLQPHRRQATKGWACLEPEHVGYVLECLQNFPMLYMAELVLLVRIRYNVVYTAQQIHHAITKAGYTRKVLEYRAREQSQPLRQMYRNHIAQIPASCLVFMDETHCKPADLRRRYGYAYEGQPAFFYVFNSAHGEGTPCSALCALGIDGMISISTTEELMNGEYAFRMLEEEVLPMMRPFPQSKSVLVMDNAPTHNHAAIVDLCNRFGVIAIFLPPYSYDLNPIEFSFHQAKQAIRSQYGVNVRFNEDRLREGLNVVSVEDAIRYYEHCGIVVTENEKQMARAGMFL